MQLSPTLWTSQSESDECCDLPFGLIWKISQGQLFNIRETSRSSRRFTPGLRDGFLLKATNKRQNIGLLSNVMDDRMAKTQLKIIFRHISRVYLEKEPNGLFFIS